MALTDIQIKQTKAKGGKDLWLTDEKGLRLLVKASSGAKYWRFKYRIGGKQKTLALGVYPEVNLKEARIQRDKARELIRNKQDPMKLRKDAQEKAAKLEQEKQLSGRTFEIVAKEWWEFRKGRWTEDHGNRVWVRLRDNTFPMIGNLPIDSISKKTVMPVIEKIEKRGALDVARRVLQDIRRVLGHASMKEEIEVNPLADIEKDSVKSVSVQHRPALPREELPLFLNDLEAYSSRGRLLTKLAIDLLLLTFVRSKELREARWDEFDFEEKMWRIPAHRMKKRIEHRVPLSRQAIEVLEKIKTISGDFELVFPSERRPKYGMSDNTMRRAIFKLGYDDNTPGKSKAVPHGFRSTASSILNESGFNPDAIERQLAHVEKNEVRAAYTHLAHYLDERKTMMQWWADYLDKARNQNK